MFKELELLDVYIPAPDIYQATGYTNNNRTFKPPLKNFVYRGYILLVPIYQLLADNSK